MIDLKAIRQTATEALKWGWQEDSIYPREVIALLDRLEAAEKDAARYRWVREQDGFTLDRLVDMCETVLDVDSVIDTARGEQK